MVEAHNSPCSTEWARFCVLVSSAAGDGFFMRTIGAERGENGPCRCAWCLKRLALEMEVQCAFRPMCSASGWSRIVDGSIGLRAFSNSALWQWSALSFPKQTTAFLCPKSALRGARTGIVGECGVMDAAQPETAQKSVYMRCNGVPYWFSCGEYIQTTHN